ARLDDVDPRGAPDRALPRPRQRRGHPRREHLQGPVRRGARYRRWPLVRLRAGAAPGQGHRGPGDGRPGDIARRQRGARGRPRLRDARSGRGDADGHRQRYRHPLRGTWPL
ncbi:MAG: UPF0145 protein YbjQ, partial [uncultured Thermomicrobiales bacterium]